MQQTGPARVLGVSTQVTLAEYDLFSLPFALTDLDPIWVFQT
jgi:hypothetical protein